MMNDYLWAVLYAQREADLGANARRRGDDTASSGSPRLWRVHRLLVRLGLRRPPVAPVTVAAAPVTVAALPARVDAAPTTATPVSDDPTHEEKAA